MYRTISFLLLLMLPLILSANAFADQIYLLNGDRISGKIVKKEGDKIVIDSEAAGTISVSWKLVEKIVADGQMTVKTKDGDIVNGTIEPHYKVVEVVSSDTTKTLIPTEKVDTVRSEKEQKRYEAEVRLRDHPQFRELWSGYADVGFSLTSGNSVTRALTVSSRVQRETVRNKMTFYFNAIQSQSRTNGITSYTAKGAWTGVRYDRNIGPKLFVYGSADLEHDRLQQLRLRTVLGSGFGYKWIRAKRVQLDVFGGASANNENYYTGAKDFTAEGTVGDDLKVQFTKRVKFNQRLSFYPNISDPGRVRAVYDSSLQTDINRWLGWHVTFTDRYNSFPPSSLKTNDVLLSTGMRFNLGKKK